MSFVSTMPMSRHRKYGVGVVQCPIECAPFLTGGTAHLHETAKANNSRVWYYPCDVTNAETTGATFRKAVSESRYPLRGLVTCAGISISGPAASYSMEDARRIIDVNLNGTFICAQAVAQIVQKESWPVSMVFIASMSGHVVNKVILIL